MCSRAARSTERPRDGHATGGACTDRYGRVVDMTRCPAPAPGPPFAGAPSAPASPQSRTTAARVGVSRMPAPIPAPRHPRHAAMNDLARILHDCLSELGIDEAELLRAAGVRDPVLGRRLLDRLLAEPLHKGPFARRLIAALGWRGERFEAARELELSRRLPGERPPVPFRPRVRILVFPPPPRGISGGLAANLALAMRLPPEWAELPFEDAFRRVQALLELRRRSDGRVVGYVWWLRPEEVWELDPEGVPVRRHDGRGFNHWAPDLLPGGHTLSRLPERERCRVYEHYGVPDHG